MDPERLLSQLLRVGLSSGRRVRHRGLGIGHMVTSGQGLTILGGIAIAAYEHLQQKGVFGGGARSAGSGAPGGQMEPPPLPPTPPSPEELHAKAMLLIEAMMNAAKADGAIDAEERLRILGEVEKAGATPEERAWIEAEMQKPIDTEGLLAKIHGPALGAEVYTASVLVTGNDTPAERAYLGLLAARLGLSEQLISEINRRLETT